MYTPRLYNRPVSEGPVAATAPRLRLQFHNFLIKPMQWICKYPLLLEALCSKVHGQGFNAVIVAKTCERGRKGKEEC